MIFFIKESGLISYTEAFSKTIQSVDHISADVSERWNGRFVGKCEHDCFNETHMSETQRHTPGLHTRIL